VTGVRTVRYGTVPVRTGTVWHAVAYAARSLLDELACWAERGEIIIFSRVHNVQGNFRLSNMHVRFGTVATLHVRSKQKS